MAADDHNIALDSSKARDAWENAPAFKPEPLKELEARSVVAEDKAG